MDTSLAEAYIKQHTHFKDQPPEGKCYVFDNGSSKRLEDLYDTLINSYNRKCIKYNFYTEDKEIRKKICEKLKENYELFSQLEYLIRETDVEDTEGQLKLILQYLECYDAVEHIEGVFPWTFITKDTYLYYLGYCLHLPDKLYLITTIDTAPLCHLFYEVCLHASINMCLIYINDVNADEIKELCLEGEEGPSGCTAVYTEYTDMDTAMEVLTYSSPKAPWSIHHVVVHESLHSAVITAMLDTVPAPMTVRPTDTDTDDTVRVETYRTVSELVDLLVARPIRFLSLWCEQSTQAEQLAAQANARYVWINTHADFDGPPEAALAVYTATWYPKYDMTSETYAQIARLNTKWSTLPWEERKTIVLDTMAKFTESSDASSFLIIAYTALQSWQFEDTVLVEDNKITRVVDSHELNTVYRYRSVHKHCANPLFEPLKLVIRGYKVDYGDKYAWSRDIELLFSAFNEVGVPLLNLKADESKFYKKDMKFPFRLHFGNKKVIQKKTKLNASRNPETNN